MKKMIIIFISLFILFGCTEIKTVPDIIEIDEITAKEVLINNELIPKIIYEYSNKVQKGLVIKLEPKVSEKVNVNELITVYISLGRELMTSKNATITWRNIDSNSDDNWNFSYPIVRKDLLSIILMPQFDKDKAIEWEEYCDVSVNADFSNSSLCSYIDNGFDYKLEIDTKILGERNPENLYVHLNYSLDGKSSQYSIEFKISW